MARRPKTPVNTEAWLNTYADMVTLLLCFFVLLYSMSSIDSQKWAFLVKSLNPSAVKVTQIVTDIDQSPNLGEDPVPQAPGDPDSELLPEDVLNQDFDHIYRTLKTYVEENKLEASVEVNRGQGFVFIVFRNNIFFDGNSYVLRPEGVTILDVLCEAMVGLDDQVSELRILGHTTQADPTRPNDIDGDRFLSSNRATQVLVYIQKKNVVSPKKLVSLGYGQYYPISPFDTEENRAKNRRIEILITQNDQVNLALEHVYSQINIPAAGPSAVAP